MLKQNFGRENYINDVRIRAHRIILSEMRISNHKFAMETGGFSKIPRNERVCLSCKPNSISEIEDEQHVILGCFRFNESRQDKTFWSMSGKPAQGLIC